MKKKDSFTESLFLIQVFEELADFSNDVIQSVQAGSEDATRRSVDKIRQIHADLSEYIHESKLADLVDDLDGDYKLRLSKAIRKINAAKPLIQAWCSRFEGIYKESDYLENSFNIDAHIDFLIPATWSWQQDLLVLMGNFPKQYFDALFARGQKRVVCLGSNLSEMDCQYIFINNEDDILPMVVSMSRPPPKKMKLFSLSNFSRFKNLEDVHKKITDSVNLSWMNYNTTNNIGRRWLDQGIANLNAVSRSRSWADFSKSNNKKNAIIISPGPSLDKNIERLVGACNNICLIAPAQSLKILSKYQIFPDLVVVVDPADLVYLFDGVDLSKVGGLLASPSCFSKIFELPFKTIYIFDGNQISDRWIMNIFNDEVIGVSGGSVSVDSLLFALKCGFEKIALVGQDLALTDGRQYAANSASGNIVAEIDPTTGEALLSGFSSHEIDSLDYFKENKNVTTRSLKIMTVPGYYGGFVDTLPDYYQFYLQFERIARDNTSNSIGLYNCTEGGAFISGFEHVPLSRFIEDVSIECISDLSLPIDLGNKRINQLSDFFSSSLKSLEDLNILCRRAEVNLNKIINNPSDPRARDELVVIENQILDIVKNLNFISIGIQSDLDFVIKVIARSKNISDSAKAELSLVHLILGESVRVSSMFDTQQSRLINNLRE